MIRRKLKLYTYHTFLVIPFIVLFLYAHNLGLTKLQTTYRTLLIGTTFSAIIYVLTQLVLKNRLKTGVFVTIFLFGLFQYGVIYESLETLYYKGLWPLNNIHRYLVFLYLIVFTVLFLSIKKTKHDFVRVNYFLNALVFLLLLFNLLKIYFSDLNNKNQSFISGKTNPENIRFKNKSNLPNIYYIILDGYASTSVLKKYYSFENNNFNTFLKQKGFIILDSAFSNYYNTSSSLASTLNFNYLTRQSNQFALIANNQLFNTLKNNSYRIYHMKSGYAVTATFAAADSTIFISGPNEFEKSLFKHTVLRLDDLIGFFAYIRLKSQFEKMLQFAEIKAGPKFCFLHIVAPHPPFIYDSKGSIRTKHQFAEHSWEPKESYLEQLMFINTQVEKLISDILKSDAGCTIVLQSDHGPWITAKSADEVFEARSRILYACYSKTPIHIPHTTSSVNTFRYLLNGLFDCRLPLLKDEYAGKEILMTDPILLKKIKEN